MTLLLKRLLPLYSVVLLFAAGCGVKMELVSDTGENTSSDADTDSDADSDFDSDVQTDSSIESDSDSAMDSDTVPVFGVHDGGYVTVGPWQGYTWISYGGIGTAVSTEDYTTLHSGETLCLSGNVGAMGDWSGTARIGVNIAQENAVGSSPAAISPEPGGLYIDVSNPGGTELRAILALSSGITYCAVIRTLGGMSIPWMNFNTKCWDDSGEFYRWEPIVSVAVMVPGHNTDERPFDFCINEVYPFVADEDTEVYIDTEADTGESIDTDLIPTDWQHGYVGEHGALQVDGSVLKDANGDPIALRGLSLYWSQWGPGAKYYTPGVVNWLVSDWNATVVRAALGINGTTDGYLKNPTAEMKKITTVVNAAIDAGVYIIIDWHAHNADLNPYDARAFFEVMAKLYGNYPNVIYEIWNEPLAKHGWNSVIKPYAEFVIEGIRKYDPDNLVIVGTNSWSQRVDQVWGKELEDPNVAYTLHFYAGMHGPALRSYGDLVMSVGIPIFITEWGIWNDGYVESDFNGAVDMPKLQPWLDWCDENNLSMAMWSVADKLEPSALLKPGASPDGGWTAGDLTTAGTLMHSIFNP